jgi:hypothetical protein
MAALGEPGLYELSTLADCTQAGLFGERVAAHLLSALGLLALRWPRSDCTASWHML